jgi:hypothetical protein
MKRFVLEVFQDYDLENPREWDRITTMVCFNRRYQLGDEHGYDFDDYGSWDEMEEDIIKNEDVHTILPLYLYDHGGITISTSPFGCRWDSGQVGFIYLSKKEFEQTSLKNEDVIKFLDDEVKTYDIYLRGDGYGYKVYQVETCSLGHEHKDVVDSCSGYFTEEQCKDDGEDMLKYYNKSLEEIMN